MEVLQAFWTEHAGLIITIGTSVITQLATLEVLKAKLDAGMATVTETTDKFL